MDDVRKIGTLAARSSGRSDCSDANTRCIRDKHDAAIGPSGGQPHEWIVRIRRTRHAGRRAASRGGRSATPPGFAKFAHPYPPCRHRATIWGDVIACAGNGSRCIAVDTSDGAIAE
ncbi:hypothetical protein [Burkholderia thailandensis]|uniref:hypothetical protein n=1 Tax=Burkholderia thailandensis TaxID=57975 RepID=UPI00016A9847|nr:hypothetical protein [Burkholderia thailandensis]AVR08375.1 hypothetical protein A8H31_06080 [Burkholderia thailandensis]AWY62657.1 hypothetical protein A8H35_25410 [Burkholderia thailandensis]AWY66190.1 hypothetical protein A8H36_10575 [Burkholderia thailandensis]NOK41195.1 hypothetical protein [Burkholderia thailandensis]NOK51760.1 hypothetical protein [Burkholderia thailandensis]